MTTTDSKSVATAAARAALCGIVLIESTDERGRPEWIVSWNALTKAFSTLTEVETWLDRVEGRKT